MNWFWLLLAAIAGSVVPIQAAANARLGTALGHPIWGVIVNTVLATAIVGGYGLVFRPGNLTADNLAGIPWWAYIGGACAAVYLFSISAAAPRLGGATLIGMIVLGQLVVAALLDHFGALDLPQQPLTLGRVAGLLLILVGVIAVRRF